jgi:hypothetical protein
MRIAAMITMAALAGRCAQAGEIKKSAKETVMVCMQTGVDRGLYLAQATATKVFAEIGVRLDWRRDQRSCVPEAILISLTRGTQQKSYPGALAIALPYEGIHIQVFYDRVREMSEAPRTPFVLAYVLVHEITHILQGMEGHSETGIMKAKWSAKDFDHMAWRRLAFAEEDVSLIYLGLATRASRMASIREAR